MEKNSRETQVPSSKENQNKKSKKLILLRSNVWDGGPKKLKYEAFIITCHLEKDKSESFHLASY